MDSFVNLAKQSLNSYTSNEETKQDGASHGTNASSNSVTSDQFKANIREAVKEGAASLMESTKDFLLAAHQQGMKGAAPHLNKAKEHADESGLASTIESQVKAAGKAHGESSGRFGRDEDREDDGRDNRYRRDEGRDSSPRRD